MLMTGLAGVGVAMSGAQEPQQEPEPAKVLVTNSATESIPVTLHPRTTVALREGTTVALRHGTEVALVPGTTIRIEPPIWEYRELRIPTAPGNTASVIGPLSSAGADGWETTGLQFSSPGATVIVLKRPRR